MSIGEWVRKTPMTDIAALANQFLIFGAALWFMDMISDLIHTSPADYLANVKEQLVVPSIGNTLGEGAAASAAVATAMITSILAAANTHISQAHQSALSLAQLVATLLGVKLLGTAGAHIGNRFSSKERYEAMARLEAEKSRGKEASAQEAQSRERLTREHQALRRQPAAGPKNEPEGEWPDGRETIL